MSPGFGNGRNGTGSIPFKGQFPQLTTNSIGSAGRDPRLTKSSINLSTGITTNQPTNVGGYQADTKLAHGPTGTTEQFKGLPNTGFTPGTVMFQQKLRLMFIQLVQGGMSHKDAAVHIQKTYGFHARTGQKIVARTEKTKTGKIKYAGKYLTKKHYRGIGAKSGHHRPRKQTPAGLK